VYGVATGTTFLDDSATGNGAEGTGGGIYNYDKQLTLTGDSFIGDTATFSGGGLYTTGPVTASQDTFSADHAPTGAGINAGGFVTLTNSTLTGDVASAAGGGINDTSKLTMSDDTLSGDTAPAGEGPGINDGSTVLLGSSILDNAGCTIATGAVMTSESYNVESDNSCALGSGNVVSNSSIGLATTLAANGSSGPETLAIGPASSATDEVPSAACTPKTDERGDARPGVTSQSACDAGAYEYQGSVTKPPVTTKPSAPRSPHAKAGKKSITVSWKAPSSTGGLTISAYHVFCSLKKKVSTKGGGSAKTTGKHLSVKVKKLRAKKKYYCVVVATNAKGGSPASATVSAKTKK
jgi:predicted outer membrane repeat protein